MMLDAVAENAALEAELNDAFRRVLHSGRYVLGEEVEQFETRCRDYLGVKHAIGVSSGTDALLLALMALGIGEGDEVLCPGFTFFATAGSIARTGARPVFVDVEEGTFNLDLKDAARRITQHTKAIMPVHLYGRAVDMDAVESLAAERGLLVIEDAAQSFGARHRGRPVGGIGDFGVFSFYPTKNLGAFGDAGLLVTNHDELADLARCLRVHGGHRRYYHDFVGGNFRLDALQAALLNVKLGHLDEYTARRRENAAHYNELLAPLAAKRTDLVLPESPAEEQHVWNQYTLRLKGEAVRSEPGSVRDALREHLASQDIASEIYYPVPLHRQNCFADLKSDPLPVSERLAGEVLSLPNHPLLTADQRERVAEVIAVHFAPAAAEAATS
jgi:dTDP-4-amino-4,6-dideoxygalactose transaminase